MQFINTFINNIFIIKPQFGKTEKILSGVGISGNL